MRFKIAKEGGYPPRYHSFPGIREVVVGRSKYCDIHFVDIGLARKHCRIEEREDGSLLIFDLGSTNGTYVNGERIEMCSLAPGDEIRLGRNTLWLQSPDEPEPTPTQEELQEAASPRTAPERLKELAQKMWSLARVVAKNSSAPPELLEWLGRGDDSSTWEALAENPSTPPRLLLRLSHHFPQKLLENPVFPLLFVEEPGLFQEIPVSMLKEMFCRFRAEGRPLEIFLTHPNSAFQEWVKQQLSSEK